MKLKQTIIWTALISTLFLWACDGASKKRKSIGRSDYQALQDSLIEDFALAYEDFEKEIGVTAKEFIASAKAGETENELEAGKLDASSSKKIASPTLALSNELGRAKDQLIPKGGSRWDSDSGQLADNQQGMTPRGQNSQVEHVLRIASPFRQEVYVATGTRRQLTRQGIIGKQEQLNLDGKKIDEELRWRLEKFEMNDPRYFDSLKWKTKKAKLITDHPEDSYRWEEADGEWTLKVLDKHIFWLNSPYLVVMID
ncbi:MAG: hypothetical protein AAF804_09725 [Bacteroidota bacterium]